MPNGLGKEQRFPYGLVVCRDYASKVAVQHRPALSKVDTSGVGSPSAAELVSVRSDRFIGKAGVLELRGG